MPYVYIFDAERFRDFYLNTEASMTTAKQTLQEMQHAVNYGFGTHLRIHRDTLQRWIDSFLHELNDHPAKPSQV